MGQAKRRGTFEERKAAAIKRNASFKASADKYFDALRRSNRVPISTINAIMQMCFADARSKGVYTIKARKD